MTSALVALVCLGASALRPRAYQRCRLPWRPLLEVCATAGHLLAWCRRRAARLASWPSAPGPVPRCGFCERAATHRLSRHADGQMMRCALYVCDEPSCERRRPIPYDCGGWPSDSLAPLTVVQQHQLSAERALLRGAWAEVADHDRRARVWRLMLRVRRVRLAWAEQRSAYLRRCEAAEAGWSEVEGPKPTRPRGGGRKRAAAAAR